MNIRPFVRLLLPFNPICYLLLHTLQPNHTSPLSAFPTRHRTSDLPCLCMCSLDLVVSHRKEEMSIQSLWQHPPVSVTSMRLWQDYLFLWFLLPIGSPQPPCHRDWAPTENIPVSMCVGLVNHLPYNVNSFLCPHAGSASGPGHHSVGLSHTGPEVWEFLLVQQPL